MKIFRNICRILLGMVFIFSGFVKAVDPLGFQYKFIEYFEALHLEWFIPAALTFVIIAITIEFFLGITFLFNIKVKQLSWIMLLFMVFFFFLTLWLAITNKVTDCGCFGDFVVLTNLETFLKNVVLLGLALVVFLTRKKFVNNINFKVQAVIALLGIGFILFIELFSLCHLPILDFMPWKKGNVIAEQLCPTPEKADIFLVYKNKETGQQMEYTAKTLPYKDTVLWKKLEFVEQKKRIIQEYHDAPIHDFSIDDINKESHNLEIIANPSWQFLLVSYDLDKATKKVFDKVNTFAEQCAKDSIAFTGLTGSDWQKIDHFRHDITAKFDFYVVDATALKSVVRSNPGLVLLKDGVVIDKWAWRDIPAYDEFKANQPKYEEFLAKVKGEKRNAKSQDRN
jgi:uncharacterized membrane protein YphA (DoxX/SURF4 family)